MDGYFERLEGHLLVAVDRAAATPGATGRLRGGGARPPRRGAGRVLSGAALVAVVAVTLAVVLAAGSLHTRAPSSTAVAPSGHDVPADLSQLHIRAASTVLTSDGHVLGLIGGSARGSTVAPLVAYVERQLIARLGVGAVQRGGLRVVTTISWRDQRRATDALQGELGRRGARVGALVSIDPATGGILAIQGAGARALQIAISGARQPGSVFDVFSLMTLIGTADGDPFLTYYDSHYLAPGWLPAAPSLSVTTSEASYRGRTDVAQATAVSDNTVFAQLAADLGLRDVDRTADAMGITAPLSGDPGEATGALRVGVSPLQVADAYATLANGGTHHTPTILDRVVFPGGRAENLAPAAGTRVFTPAQAYEATKLLESVVTQGTGTAAAYGCPAAGKTGSTSDFTDAWFAGYTPTSSTTVWVGSPNETASMPDGFGGTLAAPIWHRYSETAGRGSCERFTAPPFAWTGTAYHGAHTVSLRSHSVP